MTKIPPKMFGEIKRQKEINDMEGINRKVIQKERNLIYSRLMRWIKTGSQRK